MRQGAAGVLTNTETVPHVPKAPKTFGIPLHTCVMSSLHQVIEHVAACIIIISVVFVTRSQAVARIADRTATQQTLVISDCC